MTAQSNWERFWGALFPDTEETATAYPVKDDPMKFIVAPGRFDRSPRSVKRAMRQYVRLYSPLVISGTEYQEQARADALQVNGRTLYRKRHGGTSAFRELTISVDTERARVRDFNAVEVTDISYERVGGGIAPPRVFAWVILEMIRSGRTVMYGTYHLPATGQSTRFGDGPRFDAWKESVNNTVRIYNSHDVDVKVHGADYNASLHFPNEMRAYLDDAFKRARMRRALGTRGVDGFYERGLDVTNARTIDSHGSSDHTAKLLTGKARKTLDKRVS